PSRPVIPAACVLGDVAAKRALIADLRRGHEGGRLRQQRVVLLDERVIRQVGKRGRRADLDAAVRSLLHTTQSIHTAEIDDDSAALVAVLEPVERIEAAGEHPRILVVLLEQRDRSVYGGRLKQLEDGHYIVDDCHVSSTRLMQNAKFKM